MSFDFFIIIAATSEFVLFLLLHIVVFRHIQQDAIIKWLVYLYLFTSIVGALLIPGFNKSITNVVATQFWQQIAFALTIILILFTLLVSTYVIGIFGIIESSIRIRILSLIAYTKTKGLTTTALFRIYNKKTIVEKRLARFVSSGSVIVRNRKYYAVKQSVLLTFIGTSLNLYSRIIYAKNSKRKQNDT